MCMVSAKCVNALADRRSSLLQGEVFLATKCEEWTDRGGQKFVSKYECARRVDSTCHIELSARCEPRAAKETIGFCLLSTMTRLSGSPSRVPSEFFVQQVCFANVVLNDSSCRSSILMFG